MRDELDIKDTPSSKRGPNAEKLLQKAIANDDLHSVYGVLGKYPCQVNARVEGERLIEWAWRARPEILVALLRYGADANQILHHNGTMLSLNPPKDDDKVRYDILFVAGAKLTDGDHAHLARYKQIKMLPQDYPLYVERVGQDLPKPTAQSLKKEYNIDFTPGEKLTPGKKPPAPPKPSPGTRRSLKAQYRLDAALYETLSLKDARLRPQRMANSLMAGGDMNAVAADNHSLLFHASNSNSRENFALVDLLWALGARLNETDAEFFSTLNGYADIDDDNIHLKRQLKEYPQKQGARHLYELVSGIKQPTVESVCDEYGLRFDMPHYLTHRPYEAPGKKISEAEHRGLALYQHIAADALVCPPSSTPSR